MELFISPGQNKKLFFLQKLFGGLVKILFSGTYYKMQNLVPGVFKGKGIEKIKLFILLQSFIIRIPYNSCQILLTFCQSNETFSSDDFLVIDVGSAC